MEHKSLEIDNSDKMYLKGKSWIAYIPVILIGSILLAASVVIFIASWILGLIGLIVTVSFTAYHYLYIRSYKLYLDGTGVWYYSGVLPWQKATRGVKWRDLDEAVFFPSFWGWLTKSYSIQLNHRYTKSSEIHLKNMHHGVDSVHQIMLRHHELISNGNLK